MNYRKFGRLDFQPSALGFGCMRFPVLEGDPGRIDEDPAAEMLQYAVDQGLNYIDTAYPYHIGTSESFVGRVLANGYRDKVKLATKLPCWKVEKAEDFDRFLNEQLENLQTERIDFYLLHALDEKSWNKVHQLGVLPWLETARQDGRISWVGFSFHDELNVFQSIIDAYPEWDFCQIQYNFMDQAYQAGQAGLRYAAERGIGVVVMEPLRGGRLVDPPRAVQDVWDSSGKDWSAAEWGLQWLWNQPEVSLVLSGMSTMEQVKENLASASRSGVGRLSSAELGLIEQVKETYQGFALIPCTHCGYCIPCPEGVDIPRILEIYNQGVMFEKMDQTAEEYRNWVPQEQKADLCIECGECREKCPQDIPIPDWLAKIHQSYSAPDG